MIEWKPHCAPGEDKELEVVYLPLAELREYEGNAKIHDRDNIDAIKASIERFGNCDPIGIWTNPEGEHVIVEGHGRKIALSELGHDTAPTISLDHLTDEERRAYAIAHNQTTLMSGFDTDMLSMEIESLGDFQMEEFGLDGLTIDEKEYEDVDEVDPLEGDAVPARCSSGDVWILGDHRLMCGDSTSETDVSKLMGAASADLILTDPPYNVGYVGGTKDALTIANDRMGDAQFESFLVESFKPSFAKLQPGAAFYIWHASSSQRQFENAINAVGSTVRQQLIWVKNHFTLGKSDYQHMHEPCFYGWKPGAAHRWYSDRKQASVYEDAKPADLSKMKKPELLEHCRALSSMIAGQKETVLRFDKPTSNAEHPTMKPVKLMGYLVENSTKAGEVVLDMFGGSGSTLIACEQLSRACRTMEIDPKYCDVIIERWERLTGKTAEVER